MDRYKQLKDFLEHKLSEQESKEFVEWFLSEGGREKLSAAIDDAWDQPHKNENYAELDIETLLKKTHQKKNDEVILTHSKSHKKEVRLIDSKKRLSSWKIAASITIVFLLSLLTFQLFKKVPKEDVIQEKIFVTKSNPSGMKTKIRLPDGSMVYLNSESSITYPKDFISDRKITLIGEAFFEVKKDSLHPFEVKSHRLITQALGTSFNIKAFEKEKIEVALLTGKVSVSDKVTDQVLFLDPGEGAVVKGNSPSLKKQKIDIKFITQWMYGVLEFKKTPFPEIIKELERWYGVTITVKGDASAIKGSGRFRDGESLDNVLDVLSYSMSFDYAISKNEVTINLTQ
ncbi:FecR family protein [Echinicola sp. 20G]|uniref:FecR family protein n=1 Tax=Echinicola sp. 20G TaxID=2781961 RepID=UPI001910CB8F|nr:FecR family protein [Echinicola sp. 20G]